MNPDAAIARGTQEANPEEIALRYLEQTRAAGIEMTDQQREAFREYAELLKENPSSEHFCLEPNVRNVATAVGEEKAQFEGRIKEMILDRMRKNLEANFDGKEVSPVILDAMRDIVLKEGDFPPNALLQSISERTGGRLIDGFELMDNYNETLKDLGIDDFKNWDHDAKRGEAAALYLQRLLESAQK
jgi:hypothetical protein